MSALPEKAANNIPETERKATSHTALLLPGFRSETLLKSGLLPAPKAVHTAGYDGTTYSNLGTTCRAHMRLADELPFYEVAFRGKVYRLLARPVAGQGDGAAREDLKFELARAWAPGLRADGWLLAAPDAVPNTPRALIDELLPLLDASLEDVLEHAYSLFHYRLDHEGIFPLSLEPEGYALREVLLAEVDADGTLNTLYETPKGTNVELWTMVLEVLDLPGETSLADYASSSAAARELGESGVAALRRAMQMRGKRTHSANPGNKSSFFDFFPRFKEKSNLAREVGCRATFI